MTTNRKRVGVVLSGCGVYDGAEIHEAVITLLAIDRAGAEAVCMAPDVEQMHVVNHLTGEPAAGERRNVLVEAARIARGKVRRIDDVEAAELDALVLPGGYGAAKNLCDFAVAGAEARALPEVTKLVREVHAAGKPLGFICIAPAVAAAVFRGTGISPKLTIGDDAGTAAALEAMGARHQVRAVTDIEIDADQRIVSTPAYMCARSIAEAAEGIEKLVKTVLDLA